MPKITKKKVLAAAPAEMLFWVHQGPALKDLAELRDALKEMADEIFAYHVNAEKNDFARWIENVFQEAELAQKLLKAKSRQAAIRSLNAYLKATGF